MYELIHAERETIPVARACRVLEVSRSGYYEWLHRKPSARDIDDAVLAAEIEEIFHEHRGRYGAPRIRRALRRRGTRPSKKRIARVMRRLGLRGRTPRRFRKTTDSRHTRRIAPNLLAALRQRSSRSERLLESARIGRSSGAEYALNARIRELLVDLNNRVMRRYGKSRRELFEQLERDKLRPLPPQRFECAEWSTPRANIDYHVVIDGHYYSVPYALRHEALEARATQMTIEIYHQRGRVCAHRRSYIKGGYTTVAEHMPSAHRAHAEWTPTRILSWAQKLGPCTRQLAAEILQERPHPEQGFRSCLGILRLAKRYGDDRVEAASKPRVDARCASERARAATSNRS